MSLATDIGAGGIGATIGGGITSAFGDLLGGTAQKQYYDYILSIHPKRVIFNPGTGNDEFSDLLKSNGIEPQEACTLVLLGTGQY